MLEWIPNNHGNQQLGSCTKDPGKAKSFTQDPGDWIFHRFQNLNLTKPHKVMRNSFFGGGVDTD